MPFNITPAFVTHLLINQLRPLPLPTTNFSGKTVIVTGANTGLGREAARHFARLGAAKVILGCRSSEKGEAAKRDIETTVAPGGSGGGSSGGDSKPAPAAVVEVWPLDLCSFESVREFCRRADALERLDVVVENAGISTQKFILAEGYESTITVNVISTFLMAFLLLPALRRTAARFNTTPHLSFVASDAHTFAAFKERSDPKVFDAYKLPERMGDDRYFASKLIEILVARELAERMGPSSPVVVNMLNPGFCKSELFRTVPLYLKAVINFGLLLIGRTSEMGSRTLLAAACAGPDTHGKYMDSGRLHNPSPYVLSDDGARMGKKLFDELVEILEGAVPGISKNCLS